MLFRKRISFVISATIIFGGIQYSCNSKDDSPFSIQLNKNNAEVTQLLRLGQENQGEQYQFGNPIGVRTDSDNSIYVADRASLTIRMFDEKGNFVKEIGRRGRGPSEFLDINSFEISPEENLFVLDRGNMRYTHIKKDGEFVSSEPIDFSMEWQFYPDDIDYYEDKIIALFNDGVFNETKPLEEKELFYLYDRELKNKIDSFLSFSEFQDIHITKFAWVTFLGRPGSFILNRNKDELFYSPLIYHGNIYNFIRDEEGWELKRVIRSKERFEVRDSYVEFEQPQFENYRSKGVPGLVNVMYGGGDPNIGRVNTFDAGIHQLSDYRVIVFTGKWRDLIDNRDTQRNIIDIYAQLIDTDYAISSFGLITSVEASKMPWKPLINWKDSEGNFYLLDNTDINYPSITKFRIEGLIE